MLDKTRPNVIALCGNPHSGKTEAQLILKERFDIEPIDSGFPMRDFGMRHLGLTHDQVFTQEGKKELITIAGVEMESREFLGEMGNAIEEKFGPWAIPYMAYLKMEPGYIYCDASCRRDQGAFWKKYTNAIVIEIDNPLAGPSKYEFDQFDCSLVDFKIMNHALAWGYSPATARDDLMVKLHQVLNQTLWTL